MISSYMYEIRVLVYLRVCKPLCTNMDSHAGIQYHGKYVAFS